jgi:hypothetical protein
VSLAQSTKKHDAGRIPGPVAIANCIEIVLFWTQANTHLAHTILHGRNAGSFVPSVGQANTLFGTIGTSYTTNLASYQPTGTSLTYLTIRDMTATTNPIFQSTAAAVAGTSASIAMPENVALVLTANTTLRGRGRKGRAYIPNWATNADASGGLAVSALTAAMNAFGTALISNMNAIGLTSTIANPARNAYIGYTGTTHAARAAGMNDVSSWTLKDLIWDTQRRRVQL